MINDMKMILLRNIYYKYIKANRYPVYKRKELNKNVHALKSNHEGESCFIIGNGPSLTVEDLDLIANSGYCSFAANSIFKMFDKTKWRPTYLVYQDQQMIDGLLDEFCNLSNECEKMIVRRDVYHQLKNKINKCANVVFPKLVMHIRKDRYYDFSEELTKCAYDGCTVTYFSIQLAYYMGFKNIYLIGMDHTFPIIFDENDNIVEDKNIKMHCFEDPKNVVLNPARVLETTYAYRSARKFLESHGVNIFNATRGGKLEEFNRINVDKIFCEEEI